MHKILILLMLCFNLTSLYCLGNEGPAIPDVAETVKKLETLTGPVLQICDQGTVVVNQKTICNDFKSLLALFPILSDTDILFINSAEDAYQSCYEKQVAPFIDRWIIINQKMRIEVAPVVVITDDLWKNLSESEMVELRLILTKNARIEENCSTLFLDLYTPKFKLITEALFYFRQELNKFLEEHDESLAKYSLALDHYQMEEADIDVKLKYANAHLKARGDNFNLHYDQFENEYSEKQNSALVRKYSIINFFQHLVPKNYPNEILFLLDDLQATQNHYCEER